MGGSDPIPDLLEAVNDASSRAFALWITFLTAGIYLAIVIGTTTHVQRLLGGPVRLPLLGVDLPLFVVLHLYALMQLYLLARSLRLFDTELKHAPMGEKDRRRIRAQLDNFVLTQLLVGAPAAWLVRQFLRVAVWLSFLVAPVALLLGFQLQFLPYHSVSTTWVHRVALMLDIGLLWALWPSVSAGGTHPARLSRRWPVAWRALLVFGCTALVVYFFAIATIPGEWVEGRELALAWPIHREPFGQAFWWPTWFLFGGKVDLVRSRSTSLFSRNLILIDAHLEGTDLIAADLDGAGTAAGAAARAAVRARAPRTPGIGPWRRSQGQSCAGRSPQARRDRFADPAGCCGRRGDARVK